MGTTSFNRSNIREIKADIQSILEVIEDQYGIGIELGNGRYSNSEFSFKITCRTPEKEDGAIMTTAEKAYNNFREIHRPLNGKKMKKLGEKFECQGQTFTITGWSPRAQKYPLLAINEKGKPYKFSLNFAYI